jgi:MOSC domain-containing protein YiiM
MDEAFSAQLVAGRGIVGNANQGGKRQVTLLSTEMWGDVTAALLMPDPSIRRANLLLSSIDLRDSRGRILRIGGVRVRIYGETRPCWQMDEALPGLRNALSGPWGGGAFGEVLDDGVILVGESADWESESASFPTAGPRSAEGATPTEGRRRAPTEGRPIDD